ncbi:MAG: protein-methionine-sulfoxide reductase catalytic subunit MsrP [Cyanobacteria bacterium REEB459]|nr:protein-methionine-sulfoxide reductase catalytic subunit MsrP [Cyanobacteria bacterium REEB459]
MDGPSDPLSPEITPEETFLNRRFFLKAGIWAGSTLATAGLYQTFKPAPAVKNTGREIGTVAEPPLPGAIAVGETPNRFEDIAGYNNFYEFSTNKSAVASRAQSLQTTPWTLQVGGLVEHPLSLSLEDILGFEAVQRIYRFRCVEGWSMVIPWVGFPLAKLLSLAVPTDQATHVAFESYYDRQQMPHSLFAGIAFPYLEGLRLDEALHPLTLMATGLYGKTLPNQNGAPVRLVVPWKYGFKSIKSVVKITLTDHQPTTTWNRANAREYGFYSNVNPTVNHPRWSQAYERRIGETDLRPTLMFNGYADQVAHLYTGMNLRQNF